MSGREQWKAAPEEPPTSPSLYPPLETRPSPEDRSRPSEVALLDSRGVIVAVNKAWRASVEAHGIASDSYGVGLRYVDMARQAVPGLDEEALGQGLASLLGGRIDKLTHTYATEAGGGLRWRKVEITALGDVGHVATHEDVTDLVQAQDAVSRLSDQLLKSHDDERQRAALELYDSTNQHLAAIGLGLMRLRGLLRKPEAQEVLGQMAESLSEAVRETRVLSYLTKWPGPFRADLTQTIRAFVEGFASRTGLDATFTAQDELELADKVIREAVFRVVQEALSNAYRRSGVERITVALSMCGDDLTVEVADDGQGATAPQGAETSPLGAGISGVQMRVEQLRGRVHVTSGRSGTTVVATLPLHVPEDGAKTQAASLRPSEPANLEL